ncbi:Thiolase, N-terminal domain-containing protein [Parasitella parasitica]|nr:Thiolase, N-terminal domain-containing protein [Parasitella parasitica]
MVCDTNDLPANKSGFYQHCVLLPVSRTPIGGFNGSLASLQASKLGSIAVEAVFKKAAVSVDAMEQVVTPARAAALGAGLKDTTIATTVNKVCASAIKAVIIATQTIMLGNADVVIVGGMKSMTNTPPLSPPCSVYGDTEMVDGVVRDGLYDSYNDYLTSVAAEECVTEYAAHASGLYKDEIVPVIVSGGRGKPDRVVEQGDEMVKLRLVRPAFVTAKEVTITAPNSSPLSDGATAIILCSREAAEKYGLSLLPKAKGVGAMQLKSSGASRHLQRSLYPRPSNIPA